MKLPVLISTLILSGGLILILSSCNNKSKTQVPRVSIETSLDSVVKDNHYIVLRQMAFDITPLQLGLTLTDDEIYGVVMDQDMGKGTLTLVTYKTGDADIYLSSGRGQVGGGQHMEVKKASKSFVDLAFKYLSKSTKIDSIPLPDYKCIRFYFLTPKGKFSAQEEMKNIDNKSSYWLDYYNEAKKLIDQIRALPED